MKRPADAIARSLRISASVVALMVAAPGVANAQPGGWWLGLEGDYEFWQPAHFEQLALQDESFSDLKVPRNGWGGAVELGWKPDDSPWDLVIRGRYDVSGGKSFSGTWSGSFSPTTPDGGSAHYGENHLGFDFEVGREVGLGDDPDSHFRLFGGIRIAKFDGHSKFSTHSLEAYYSASSNFPDGVEGGCYPGNTHTGYPGFGLAVPCTAKGSIHHSFIGAGPRIGFNGTWGLAPGWGIDYMAAAAALFGERSTHLHLSSFTSFKDAPLADRAKMVVVPNVEGSLALAWDFDEMCRFSLGYRADAYFGVVPRGVPGQDSERNSTNRFIHGPFLKAVFFFGGAPPPPPPPPPAPPPPPPPPPPAVKTFIVFFDFNKANLSAEAESVVTEAVRTAKANGFVRVMITGHTDTVGSDSYNQALSERRAEAVKDDMVRQGMDGGQIAVAGKSFHDPLVPTGPGVREPQNRRAVIDLGAGANT
jgi:outer membrane protein OmpA-like peptidoglycan-associated protein